MESGTRHRGAGTRRRALVPPPSARSHPGRLAMYYRRNPTRFHLSLTLAAVAAAGLVPSALRAQEAVPTRLLVRAVANDAKVIGSGVGGARITVLEAGTGEVLAEGVQEGSTGDTGRIMGTPARGDTVFDVEGTAGWETTLSLTGPTPVEIVAEGPLGTPHATQRATTTLLLLPGKDVVGEGLVLVLHGFTVEILGPDDGAELRQGQPLTVRARVTMLCGCPTEPGGRWDSDRYTIRAELVRSGAPVAAETLAYAGETSTYEGTLSVPASLDPGEYTLRVTAADPARANLGMAETVVRAGR